ncbi:DUF1622 domain-containing protein [Micromonospora sp. NPDC047074]|uniref:DUF1622 domain-containing protein n=1 Tax=Micromonospora sp. NPDC047074 TaxID=3154339 RepID=UPI0033F621F0
MSRTEIVDGVGYLLDLAGVLVIAIGVAIASIRFLLSCWRTRRPTAAYRPYRQGVGRAILLGLELLVAGDIIRTVAVSPTFYSVGVLALIVAVRTFLSVTLEVELEGRWPWQRRPGIAGLKAPAGGEPAPAGDR